MTTADIICAIKEIYPEAELVRRAKSTFLAIPMGKNEDGVMEYAKVVVRALITKSTQANPAFDFDEAKAEYESFRQLQREKAKKCPNSKPRYADPIKQAAKEKRKTALVQWLKNNPGHHTALEIFNTLPEVYVAPTSFMTVGSDAKELLRDGLIRCERQDNKNYWYYEG